MLKHLGVAFAILVYGLVQFMPAYAESSPAQPDPLVVMDDVTVPEGESFSYSVKLQSFRFNNVTIRIAMGPFDVHPELVNVSGVDTFGTGYDAESHVLELQLYAFETSEGAVITIPLDAPMDAEVITTYLRIGDDLTMDEEVARGRVAVMPQRVAVFLPTIVTYAVVQ